MLTGQSANAAVVARWLRPLNDPHQGHVIAARQCLAVTDGRVWSAADVS